MRVRSGTGDIEFVASGDLIYGDDTSAIYTTGLHTGFGEIKVDPLYPPGTYAFLIGFVPGLFDYGPAIPDATEASIERAPWFFDKFIPGIGFKVNPHRSGEIH